jgi:FKBP-type peptidyl-prolyl cis-trans isomerase (trigger factor)
MKVSVLKQDGLSRELEVTVPAATILKNVEAQLVSYGKKAKIAGFRPWQNSNANFEKELWPYDTRRSVGQNSSRQHGQCSA